MCLFYFLSFHILTSSSDSKKPGSNSPSYNPDVDQYVMNLSYLLPLPLPHKSPRVLFSLTLPAWLSPCGHCLYSSLVLITPTPGCITMATFFSLTLAPSPHAMYSFSKDVLLILCRLSHSRSQPQHGSLINMARLGFRTGKGIGKGEKWPESYFSPIIF